MKQITILAAFVFCATILQAQTVTETELHKEITLTDSTIDRKLYFEVIAGTPNVDFLFTVTLTSGHLSFTVTDPEGKREGGFSLDKDSKGHFTANKKSPLPGKWVVYLTSRHATGYLSYDVKMTDN